MRATRWKSWSRRRQVAVAGVVAAAVALGGTAAAAVLFRAQVTGSAQVVTARVAFAPPTEVKATSGVITCSPVVDSGTLNVEITGAMPGSFCDVEVGLEGKGGAVGQLGLKVQDVDFAPQIPAAFVQVGGGPSVCGATLSAELTTVAVIRFTVPEDATEGEIPADATAGVTAISGTDYVADDCPQVAE